MKPNTLSPEIWIDPKMHFTVQEKDLQSTVKKHWHSFYEIELILDGSGRQIYNDKKYPLSRGWLYLLTPTDHHEVIVDDTLHLYNLMLASDMIPDAVLRQFSACKGSEPIQLCEEDIQKLTALLQLLSEELRCRDEMRGLSIRSLLSAILVFVTRTVGRNQTDLPAGVSGIQKALFFVQTQFTLSPSLAEAAAVAGMSPSHFCTAFRKKIGQSYSSYLNSLKLERAKHLLVSGDEAVRQICFAGGFSSMSNFMRLFKENTGMSPLQYRKEKRREVGDIHTPVKDIPIKFITDI